MLSRTYADRVIYLGFMTAALAEKTEFWFLRFAGLIFRKRIGMRAFGLQYDSKTAFLPVV